MLLIGAGMAEPSVELFSNDLVGLFAILTFLCTTVHMLALVND